MTEPHEPSGPTDRLYRRGLLSVLGVAAASGLSGCSSGDAADSGTTSGRSGEPTTDATTGPAGSPAATGTTTGDGGDGDGVAEGSGVVGQRVRAPDAPVELVVEEVTPVDAVTVTDTATATNEPDRWGRSLPFDDWAERTGFGGAGFWAVRIALKNEGDGPLRLTADGVESTAGLDRNPVPAGEATSQRREDENRPSSALSPALEPGELYRWERVFGFPEEPGPHEFVFSGRYFGEELAFANIDVDLGEGSSSAAPYADETTSASVGETVSAGAIEMTLKEFEYAETAGGAVDRWSTPPANFRFAKLTVDATRVTETEIGDRWGMGLRDGDGYRFVWHGSLQDPYDLERKRIGQLSVGESVENFRFVFEVERGWEPDEVYLKAPGTWTSPNGQAFPVFRHGFWER